MAYEFWFWTSLKCRDCGGDVVPQQAQLEANGLNPIVHGGWVYPGDVMPVEVDEFGISFTFVRNPVGGESLRVIIGWACPCPCTVDQWARARFTVLPDGVRFDDAESIELTPGELAAAHFVDNAIPAMVNAAPPGAEGDALRAALASP